MTGEYGEDARCLYCEHPIYDCTCTFPETGSIVKDKPVDPKEKIVRDIKEKFKELYLIIDQL